MMKNYTLIVDDEKEIRNLLSTALKYMGLKTQEVSNVSEAIAKIEKDKHRISLLILDVNIGVDDGISLFSSVKAKGINISTLFISGNYSNESRIKEVCPNYTFLKKPFTPDQLENKIRKMTNYDKS